MGPGPEAPILNPLIFNHSFLFNLYFIKVLKKLNLLKRFNFALGISLNDQQVKIPFINGIGLTNYILKADWLDSVISGLIPETKGVFVDVGANIGQTLIRAKTLKPDLIYLGFEPNSTCISYLQELIRINEYKKCTLQNCALSTKTQTLILEKSYAEDSRASVVSSLRPDYFKYKDNVLSLDFDSYFSDTQIVFVKIDVEGAELDVIQGMKQSILKYKPLITCEVLDSHNPSVLAFTQHRADQLCKLLKYLNYSIVRLQTTQIDGKINGFEKTNKITIKQWTPGSYSENDYLFYPDNTEIRVLKNLTVLCN